jgi:hypothetical protein
MGDLENLAGNAIPQCRIHGADPRKSKTKQGKRPYAN